MPPTKITVTTITTTILPDGTKIVRESTTTKIREKKKGIVQCVGLANGCYCSSCNDKYNGY